MRQSLMLVKAGVLKSGGLQHQNTNINPPKRRGLRRTATGGETEL